MFLYLDVCMTCNCQNYWNWSSQLIAVTHLQQQSLGETSAVKVIAGESVFFFLTTLTEIVTPNICEHKDPTGSNVAIKSSVQSV